jgi:hypothetical protein
VPEKRFWQWARADTHRVELSIEKPCYNSYPHMDITHGLEPHEIDDGYILICQAHPISDKVVIDFDQK